MLISQKCQYGLRALYELARRDEGKPVPMGQIAEEQAIPPRFLELILAQLKQGGFVRSHRGKRGGYMLLREPDDLTIGEVIRFIEGPLGPVICVDEEGRTDCPLHGQCVFGPMWERAKEALANVFDETTFQDLLDEEAKRQSAQALSYTI